MGNGQEIILCDTNVILEFIRGNEDVSKELNAILEKNIRISVVTAMEITFGALNKRELKILRSMMDNLVVYPLTPDIGNYAYELMHTYSLSHNLDLPDALIAATAIKNEVKLYTLNMKHFRYIDTLDLYVV